MQRNTAGRLAAIGLFMKPSGFWVVEKRVGSLIRIKGGLDPSQPLMMVGASRSEASVHLLPESGNGNTQRSADCGVNAFFHQFTSRDYRSRIFGVVQADPFQIPQVLVLKQAAATQITFIGLH